MLKFTKLLLCVVTGISLVVGASLISYPHSGSVVFAQKGEKGGGGGDKGGGDKGGGKGDRGPAGEKGGGPGNKPDGAGKEGKKGG